MSELRDRLYLHECIIEFITNNLRLQRWHWLSTWRDFLNEFPYTAYELTPEQLKAEFRDVVLPQIFTYDLLPDQRKSFESLEGSAKITRTETGYEVTMSSTPVRDETIAGILQENRDYTLYGSVQSNETNIAAVLAKTPDCVQARVEFGGNIVVHRWTSALLQSRRERKSQQLLSWDEIKRRLMGGNVVVGKVQDVLEEAKFFDEIEAGVRRNYAEINLAMPTNRHGQ